MVKSKLSPTFLKVKVIPSAKQDKITTLPDGMLKIQVTAHPEKGIANKAMVKILAQKLGVKKRDIEIIQGERSSIKLIKIARNS